MPLPSNRQLNGLIAVACALLIAIALYMQHVMGLEPCYLCITQRVFIILIGAVGLLAFLHNPASSRIYGVLLALFGLAGSFFAGKQLWLQSLPEDQVPACGPPADYLFQVFDFSEALSMLLQGDGNCAEVHWTLLGVSIPGWTLLAFIGFTCLGTWQLFRKS